MYHSTGYYVWLAIMLVIILVIGIAIKKKALIIFSCTISFGYLIGYTLGSALFVFLGMGIGYFIGKGIYKLIIQEDQVEQEE